MDRLTGEPSRTPGIPSVEIAETHSGIVILAGDRAYKFKKHVDLGFLDFTDIGSRADMCKRELALNRRLAADVYLGVGQVIDPDGSVADHFVMMRRMPSERRLSHLVLSGDPGAPDQVRLVARRVAAFHGRARTGDRIDATGRAEAMIDRWQANARDIEHSPGLLDKETVARIVDLAVRYATGRRALFDERVASGRARDGHGDLLADDIFCLPDGPRILDCLEFDDHLRYGDVLSDVASLAADLERLGRADMARVFLDAYRQHSADSWPSSLEHHHLAYRAFVRAKVTALRAWQRKIETDPAVETLTALTLSHLHAGRVRLVLVGGLPASGKSTIAAALAETIGATLLGSDALRKQQAGLDVDAGAPAHFGEGLYRPELTAATYELLLDRARLCLQDGMSVVLDATFVDPRMCRDAELLAQSTFSDLYRMRCSAPLDVLHHRIRRRVAGKSSSSDATEETLRMMSPGPDPWPPSARLDTDRPFDQVLADALERLAR